MYIRVKYIKIFKKILLLEKTGLKYELQEKKLKRAFGETKILYLAD